MKVDVALFGSEGVAQRVLSPAATQAGLRLLQPVLGHTCQQLPAARTGMLTQPLPVPAGLPLVAGHAGGPALPWRVVSVSGRRASSRPAHSADSSAGRAGAAARAAHVPAHAGGPLLWRKGGHEHGAAVWRAAAAACAGACWCGQAGLKLGGAAVAVCSCSAAAGAAALRGAQPSSIGVAAATAT